MAGKKVTSYVCTVTPEQADALLQILIGDADGAFDVPAAEVPGRADVNEDVVGFKEIAVYFPGGDGAKVHGITFWIEGYTL